MLKTSAGWCRTSPGFPPGSVRSARPTTDDGGQSSSGSVPNGRSLSFAILRVLGHTGTAVGFPIRPGGRSTVTFRMFPPSGTIAPSGLTTRFISNAVQAS